MKKKVKCSKFHLLITFSLFDTKKQKCQYAENDECEGDNDGRRTGVRDPADDHRKTTL